MEFRSTGGGGADILCGTLHALDRFTAAQRVPPSRLRIIWRNLWFGQFRQFNLCWAGYREQRGPSTGRQRAGRPTGVWSTREGDWGQQRPKESTCGAWELWDLGIGSSDCDWEFWESLVNTWLQLMCLYFVDRPFYLSLFSSLPEDSSWWLYQGLSLCVYNCKCFFLVILSHNSTNLLGVDFEFV